MLRQQLEEMNMDELKTVKLSQLLDVWESFTGWYWFVTERHERGICFGLVRGFETEWGYFSTRELLRLQRRFMVWKVPRRNWALCPCVIEDAASCLHHTEARP